jgi:hypothetical protein
MSNTKIENILKCISDDFNINYTELLHTLAKYYILPQSLKSTYSQHTIYQTPAIKLIADKYKISPENFNSNNKMKIINLKRDIKQREEAQFLRNYLFFVFIKKLGLQIGLDLVRNYYLN